MQTHANTLSARSFPSNKQINSSLSKKLKSSVELWKFRIKKQLCVRAGRCMRTMSRPRHVRRREHNTPGPNISHAQASPLARHSLNAHTPRDARSWWPHQQHGIFEIGAHSYKQTTRSGKQASMHAASSCQSTKSTNQDGDRQRRSELPYHTSRQEHKKMPRMVVLRGLSPLAMPLGCLDDALS